MNSIKTIKNIALVWICMTAPLTFTTNLVTDKSIQGIILAAGHGSRFKTGITKMITPICGKPMVAYAVSLMENLSIPAIAIIGYQKERVQNAIEQYAQKPVLFAEQKEQLGTGHALLISKNLWDAQNILVINGDMPIIAPDIITALAEEHFKQNAAISIVTSYNVDPANTFGRIVQHDNHVKIVEKKHFTGDIKDHPYVNVGIYLMNRDFIEKYADTVKQNDVSHEFYITDLIEIASDNNLPVVTLPMPFDTLYGVNTFQELAQVEQMKRDELIHHWMAQGVRFIAPQTVHLDFDVTIGKGTVIYPGVQILNGTKIGEFCTIKPHAVLDNVVVGNNTTVQAQSVLNKVSL